MNPVIPEDHPDCTLSKVGNDFYITGSSFNPTPVIYHSTDLVHWEAVAQSVSSIWINYGDAPAGGCWGGQVVYYNNKWWDFFSHNNQMYFVTADSIKGPWTLPTLMKSPSSVPGLGYYNSIFIYNDSTWYLLVKNGQVNNWIVQLGNNGHYRYFRNGWLTNNPNHNSVLGNEIAVLVNGMKQPGNYSVSFSGKDLSSGINAAYIPNLNDSLKLNKN